MKKRFYYNDKLIRTSENHTYTHALLNTNDECMTCSSKREGCEKELRRMRSNDLTQISNHENRIKAINAGREGYTVKDGKYTFYARLPKSPEEREHEAENARRSIEWHKHHLQTLEEYKIVELEQR